MNAEDREIRAARDFCEQSRNRVCGAALVKVDDVVEALRPIRPVDRAAEAVSLGDALPDLLDLAHCFRIDRGKGETGRMPVDRPAPRQRVAVENLHLRCQREGSRRRVKHRQKDLAVDHGERADKPMGSWGHRDPAAPFQLLIGHAELAIARLDIRPEDGGGHDAQKNQSKNARREGDDILAPFSRTSLAATSRK